MGKVIVFLTLRLVVGLVIGGCSWPWMMSSTSAQEIRIFPGKSGPTITIPSESTSLRSTAILVCGIEPTSFGTQLNHTSRWITPSGEVVNFTNDRFTFIEGEAVINSTKSYPATVLWVKKLTYRDAGVYTCEGRSTNSPWVSATIQLQLSLELQSINSTVMTTTDEERAELTCEMSAFIRPDSSLVWVGPDGERITTAGAIEKYQITFSNGSPDVSVNGTLRLAPSRVSTLFISNPQLSDAGDYTCSVIGTEQATAITLNVANLNSADDAIIVDSSTKTSDLTTTTPDLNTMSSPVSPSDLTAVIAGSVATVIGLILILTTATITLCIIACKNKRMSKTSTRISESNYVYPIYDYPTDVTGSLNNEYQTVDVRNVDAKGRGDVGGHGIEDLNRIEAYAVSNLNESSYDFIDVHSDDLSSGTDIILERNEAYGEVITEVDYENTNVYAEID